MYRKLLNTARKRPLAVSVLAICAVTALVLFLRSDALFPNYPIPARMRVLAWGRVVPPLPSSVTPLPADASPGADTTDDTDHTSHDTVLSHINMMYGTIEFVQRHQHFVYSEDGDSFSVEEHVYTSVEVPDTVRGIDGLDDGRSYQDRMRAVHSLPDNLSVKEQTALLHNRLLDSMIRDYAIQFLGQCYHLISTPEHRHAARETLFTALADTAHIAATAIIAIDGLAEFSGFSRKRIADEAYKLAADPETADNVRIPALQIAAKHKHPKALELARDILSDSWATGVFSGAMSSRPCRLHFVLE